MPLRRTLDDPGLGADLPPQAAAPPPRPRVDEASLLALVDDSLREWHAGAPGLPAVTLASVLDRDLGLDSLARMELLLRIEREFGVALPEDTLARAETVADLLPPVNFEGRVG